MSHLTLLRHGATIGGDRYNGSTDVTLSEAGWQQFADAVNGRHWDRIITSPLRRCADFACRLAHERDIPCGRDTRLREMHFGDWEGRNAEELMRMDAEALGRFWEDPAAHPPPAAESLAQVRARMLSLCREIAAAPADERILLVTHGGPIRIALAECRGIPLRQLLTIAVPHASLFELDQANARCCVLS